MTSASLGKWLHVGATAQEKSSPHYGPTVQAHKQFHTVAGGVLANALAGKKAEAQASMAPGGDFARASVAVMQALQAWKRYCVTQTRAFACEATLTGETDVRAALDAESATRVAGVPEGGNRLLNALLCVPTTGE